MIRSVAISALAVALGLSGCAQPQSRSVGDRPPAPSDRADVVTLWAEPPAPVNWDDVPGPDGLRGCVYLFQADRALPVTVTGSLEFRLYAGRLTIAAAAKAEPIRVWRFGPDVLPRCLSRGLAGWGYRMVLDWGRDAPNATSLTLVAVYVPPQGPPVASAPISVAMGSM